MSRWKNLWRRRENREPIVYEEPLAQRRGDGPIDIPESALEQAFDKVIDGYDPVIRPAHYCDGGIETLDFILAKKLDYLTGQVCKYICRAGKKDPAKELEDLKKARFYLERKIRQLEEGKS